MPYYQHIAFTAELDVFKKTGAKQRSGCIDQPTVVSCLTDIQRQRAKDTASRDSLQTVDAYIGNSEGLGVNFGNHQCGNNRR